MKEGFLIYTGLYSSIREFLTLEQKGMLLDALHDFQESGIEPPKNSPIAMPFAIYKNQFRLDGAKHEKRAERARQNGRNGGRPKAEEKETQNNPENPVGFSETQNNPDKPRESYKEKENDKVKDKDKDKDKVEGESTIYDSGDASASFVVEVVEPIYRELEEFVGAYGTVGHRGKTESHFIEAMQMLKNNGNKRAEAAKMLIDAAASYRAFCIAIGRKMRDPHNWLKERDWERDYLAELQNHRQNERGKSTNGAITNIIEFSANSGI